MSTQGDSHPFWDKARADFHDFCDSRNIRPRFETSHLEDGRYTARVWVENQWYSAGDDGPSYSSRAKARNAVAAIALDSLLRNGSNQQPSDQTTVNTTDGITSQQSLPSFEAPDQELELKSKSLNFSAEATPANQLSVNPNLVGGNGSGQLPNLDVPDFTHHPKDVFIVHVETSRGIGGLQLPAPDAELVARVTCIIQRLSVLFDKEEQTMAQESFVELDNFMRTELTARLSVVEIENGKLVGHSLRACTQPDYLDALMLPKHPGPEATLELKKYYAYSHRGALFNTFLAMGPRAVNAWPDAVTSFLSKFT